MKIKFWWLVFCYSLVQTTFLGTQRYYLYLRKESKKGEKITIQNVEFKIQNERKKPERAIKEIKENNEADLKNIKLFKIIKIFKVFRIFSPSPPPFLILGEKILRFVK